MDNILIYGFPAAAIVVGLVQLAKIYIEDRWIPLVAVLVGIAVSSLAAWNYWTPEAVVKGIVLGLVAAGLWDISKKTILNK